SATLPRSKSRVRIPSPAPIRTWPPGLPAPNLLDRRIAGEYGICIPVVTFTPSRSARLRWTAGLMVVMYASFRWAVPVLGLEHRLERAAGQAEHQVSHAAYHLVRAAVLMAEPDWPAPAPARTAGIKDHAELAPLTVVTAGTSHFFFEAFVLRI